MKRPHINADGKFQSDKYPTTPPGKVPLSVEDPTAQDLLWEYAQRRRAVDREFADDLEWALVGAGYQPQARATYSALYVDAIAGMKPEESLLLPRGGHNFRVTATSLEGFHTGRRRYKVECLSCGDPGHPELVHEATTGPESFMESHVNACEARRPKS